MPHKKRCRNYDWGRPYPVYYPVFYPSYGWGALTQQGPDTYYQNWQDPFSPWPVSVQSHPMCDGTNTCNGRRWW